MKMLVISLLSFSIGAMASTFKLGPDNASVGFSITKFKINDDVAGSFQKFEGEYSFDAQSLEIKDVTAKIAMTSVNTGNTDRDDHLKSDPNFFDTAKYQYMTFKTTAGKSFALKKGQVSKVPGFLTIKDKTHPVVLDVTYKGTKNGKPQLSAVTQIDRTKYNVAWNKEYQGDIIERLKARFANKVLADEVKISINLQ